MVTGFVLGVLAILVVGLIVGNQEHRKRIIALESALVVQFDLNRRLTTAIVRLGGSVDAAPFSTPPHHPTPAARGPVRPQ